MGLSPQEVMGLSIFEYLAALDAVCEESEGDKKLSATEKDELWEWLSSG
ncbi:MULTISPECIES: hypothetical protein [Rhizobium]|uniref:Uncharacterized protein n=1 Tax=Rhizobium favelukesii TaxID=348824 RepID=W6RC66_9HYPH|nr:MULTISPECIES: hypothetical protein [Rhizobium]MCS0462998.1 hypothetical protein [Rhizobium favelukesii]UFS82040.1 hypothetical protein LPB79_27785 [Rhizobium sp. T136]CDM56288.1 hypothetical protein LPU83_0606 [Rhizobium favelukesii]